MAWAPGPQQVSSITVGAGSAIDGSLIENYSSTTEGVSYDAAKGISVDRGFVTNTITFDCLDYSAVGAIETLMTSRALNNVDVTFLDSVDKDQTASAVARITPVVSVVPDTCEFLFATASGSFDDIAGNFTSGGVVMSEPSFDFDFPFDGQDGCGRPYFGGVCRANITFELSGIRGASTDVYAALGTFGANVDVAFKMPNGKYLGFKDMYMYFYYGDEDANGVRTVKVDVRGTATAWSSMIFFTDGASLTSTDDAWGTPGTEDPGDRFVGGNVELVGTAFTETSLITF